MRAIKAPRRPITRNQWGCITVVVLVVLGFIGCQHILSSSSSSGSINDKLSAGTKTYLASAMPMLAQATSEFQSGSVAKAVADWKSIGNIPINNDTDDFVSKDYLTYANNVRYFMVGDGSVNLMQLEDSKTKAEQTISAFE